MSEPVDGGEHTLPPEGQQPPLDLLVQYKGKNGGYKSFINCNAGMNMDLLALVITAHDGKVTTIPLDGVLYYTEELHKEEAAI